MLTKSIAFHFIEKDEMSQTGTKNKKRKAVQIDSSHTSTKDEQVAKAKKADSGERKY